MCVIFFRAGPCPKCKCKHLKSWELGQCKEATYCIASDFDHCEMTHVIHDGKMYKFGEDTKVTPWPPFCDHDGFVMLDDIQVYTNKAQGFESLYVPFYDEERDGYGPKPKKEEDEKIDEDNRRVKK